MGWATVGLYVAAALQCLRVARHRDLHRTSAEGACWRLLTVVLAALGVNKQLDLQSALTEAGRILAHQQGWYAMRHGVQRAFILVAIVMLAAATTALARMTRGAAPATRAAVLGAMLLGTFVAIRASSFHHMDALIRLAPWGVRVNWVCEIGGILMILVAGRWRMAASGTGRERRSDR